MKKVSVVIGRFQVSELHAGHIHLLKHARECADELLILVGTTEAMPSSRNPLDFTARRSMIRRFFPDATIAPLPDHPSNDEWSRRIDASIGEAFPGCEAVLFGSRDSFLPYYSGNHPTATMTEIPALSGTQARLQIRKAGDMNSDFLSGMIYAQNVRLPVSYQAVDIAVVRRQDKMVLLGRKERDGRKFRFIGGFVDPDDQTLEAAALRETAEEAGPVVCSGISYIGSFRVNDFRYRNEPDKVMTAFYVADYQSGDPVAGDDLDEVHWVPLHECIRLVIDGHKDLAKALLTSLIKK